ncbi:MAG: hypothetical protein V8R61_09830 [Enterocloster sp.]
MGLTSDARDVHIQIIRDMKDMDPAKAANIQYLVLDGNDKDKEIAAIEITYVLILEMNISQRQVIRSIRQTTSMTRRFLQQITNSQLQL